MNTIFKVLDGYLVPVILGLGYLGLVASSDMKPAIAILTLAFFGVIVFLWSGFRALRLHAMASRHASFGEPDELLALADRAIAGRLSRRGQVPFQLYRAIALELRGDWDGTRAALAAVELDRLSGKARKTWGALHAAQRINLLTHDGDGAAARHELDGVLRPLLRFVPGIGAQVIDKEAEARVLLAEGDHDGALTRFEALAKDIRLGPGTRAMCRHLAGRCVEARDPEAARLAFAAAAKLAPKTWLGSSGQPSAVS